VSTRAEVFKYAGLDVNDTTLVGHYELDGRSFSETATFEGVGPLSTPAATAVANLWYVIAGLSYYKAGAAKHVELGAVPLGGAGRVLLNAALTDGLGEFSFRNDLDLSDVVVSGGADVQTQAVSLDAHQVLTPFGGGIDSVVTVSELSDHVDQSLFVVSPVSGRFTPLEDAARVTGLPVMRVTRSLDPQFLSDDHNFYLGHVPVTAMITLLAVVGAVASGRGGVAMSNEHSASLPNLRWRDRDINHQWSKSWNAEALIANAVMEAIGDELAVASFLRDRSEVWVASQFSRLTDFHHVFRSCNRAFLQATQRRSSNWCGECDKCLFINLMLAPFLSRADLFTIFASEPLSTPARFDQLRTLVGLGKDHKPFECVGDPDESAVALKRVSQLDEWSDVTFLQELSDLTSPNRDFDELLTSQGPSRVPAHWLR
jgi:UDP-N-acetyl-alpha-D-muramoyl-L-alanyl-L-glutamate epimerase